MVLHPFMVEAIYLRQHPEDTIVKDDGKQFWFCETNQKYYWSNPNSEKRQGIYEARGLNQWWQKYLKLIESIEFTKDEGLPY